MNLLSKLLLLLIINLKIIKIKSKLPDNFCACDKLNVNIINSRIYNGRDVKSNELKYVGSIYNRFFLGKSNSIIILNIECLILTKFIFFID